MKKRLLILFLILLTAQTVSAQQHRGYSFNVRTDKNGTLNFYCINERNLTYTVRVDLSNYSNYTLSCSLPYVGEAKAGTTFLFKLTPVMPSARPVYNMTTNVKLGKYIENPDTSYIYILPLKPGKKINVFKNFLAEYWFYNRTRDTVFAVRSGTIGYAIDNNKENNIGRDNNTIFIEHSDGTIMSYRMLGNLLVKQGQRIKAGEPIALIGKKVEADNTPENDNSYCVKLRLMYNAVKLPEVVIGTIKYDADNKTSTLPVKFLTEEAGEVFFTGRASVTAVYPEELLIKEMTKSELKKYKKITSN